MPVNDDVISRNNVKIIGSGQQVMLMAHGFGCNQLMWRFLTPELSSQYKIVLFDYVGSGASNLAAYSRQKYSDLEGYAQDIIDICIALDLQNVVVVGHSVSSIISLIAAQQIPERIHSLVMVCPSPCFLNDPPHYMGGFNREDLNELIDLMDKNYIGWAQYLAPLVTGTTEKNLVTAELTDSFCSTNPITAKNFAKATFFSDYRSLLPLNSHPVLLLQSETDALASLFIGDYMHKNTPKSCLQVVPAKGHCLHMTHPEKVARHIHDFMQSVQAGESIL
ncbi:Putative hydrolase or acyltransferase of alpha/beta superfamily [Rheinheimera sp. A13L]|uniref:alpha/beta fold hydrolase n=1 Tax=Rheinheimera sp. A13L TaxID=506534 RepID=UPI00021248F7|nr:alpha/beta hydrolase [Rheinheimera sp. A13L]EGM76591.1 Putative hydrolase or acyltransferase of alpha/beta superfamily [Rheinheimera sp. A13L]